jgi:sialidase-1
MMLIKDRTIRFCFVLVVLACRTQGQAERLGANRTDGQSQTHLYVSGTEGYHTFRIPSLIITQQGTILAFCEGRKINRQDHGDVDIVLKRSTDLGETWSPLGLVYEEGGGEKITIGNPCPVIDQSTGTIWLPFCRDNNDIFITYSTDDGMTWQQPRKITASVKKPTWGHYATGPGVGIQLKRGPHVGRLLIPCDHRDLAVDLAGTVDGNLTAHNFYSDDHGKTWQLGGQHQGWAMGEPQLVELDDGTVMANIRSNIGPYRVVSVSSDGGLTWGFSHREPPLIGVEPRGTQGSIIRYTDRSTHGRSRILFSNPASTKKRERMTVRLSYDEGKTWPVSKLLHDGPSAYSCLTVLPDNRIGVMYERGIKGFRETVTLEVFSLGWLTDGQDAIEP